MVVLDESVRLVALQFSFSNPNVIPASVKRLDREMKAECVERKSCSTGIMVIEPIEKCSLAQFLGELEAEEYEMVDAFYKERIDAKDSRGKRTYHMVRFVFARHEFAELSDEFKKVRDTIRTELQSICKSALWCFQGFLNPFYKNGEEILNQYAVSINFTARQPLFRPDGQPVTVWKKDENGNRVGNAPIPLKPDYQLRVIGFGIHLMMV